MAPLFWIASALGFFVVVDKILAPTKIFVSYYYDQEGSLKRLLKAWDKNKNFDIRFQDMSADISLNTESDEQLAQELTERIKKSEIVLVLVGSETHLRKWVKYEIQEAVRLSKPIIAVKQSKGHVSPRELKGVKAYWVYGFKAKKISAAINDCIS